MKWRYPLGWQQWGLAQGPRACPHLEPNDYQRLQSGAVLALTSAMPNTHTMGDIRSCLSGRRVAFFGLSTDPASFSRAMLQELAQRGYEILPIHATAEEVAGRRSFRSAAEARRAVDWALVMTPTSAASASIDDAVRAGVRRIWIHRGRARVAACREAIAAARQAGVTVIAGDCIAMYLDNPLWFHRLHRWVRDSCGLGPAESATTAGLQPMPLERRSRAAFQILR